MSKDNVEANLTAALSSDLFKAQDTFWERHEFSRFGYLKITHLLDPAVIKAVGEDTKHLLTNFGKRRDFLIESTENTPRHLTNVPQEIIEKNGSIIPGVYNSIYLKCLIEAITGERVIPTPWKWDNYIINSQHRKGDTHGWHWGDYPFTIIWIVKAPPITAGGLLECVPHTHWDKTKPRVQQLLLENPINTYSHCDGDVYLLKADTTLHRVTPLLEDCERIILNTTWEREKDRDRKVEHETFIFRD